MADESQDKTEEPSQRRLEQSREKGQIPRSKEFNTFVLLIVGMFVLTITARDTSLQLKEIFSSQLVMSRNIMFDDLALIKVLSSNIKKIMLILSPLFITLLIAVVAGGFVIGGLNFSWESVGLKFDRLDPIKGLQKIFSLKTVMELFKSILKFVLLSAVFYLIVYNNGLKYFALDHMETNKGIFTSLKLIEKNIYFLITPLIIVVLIDVPYQIYQIQQQIKMTKQEVKDESKDSDGSPEVKSKRRQLQQEMSKKKMMSAIPEADVVITNPEHYAVAIKYDEDSDNAPIVVAKGVDYIAQLVRQVAIANNVPIVEAPPVARSLYYNVDIEDCIPPGLYIAVAKILTFIHEINLFKSGKINRPKLKEDFEIPEALAR